jgi:hypothetical protein
MIAFTSAGNSRFPMLLILCGKNYSIRHYRVGQETSPMLENRRTLHSGKDPSTQSDPVGFGIHQTDHLHLLGMFDNPGTIRIETSVSTTDNNNPWLLHQYWRPPWWLPTPSITKFDSLSRLPVE